MDKQEVIEEFKKVIKALKEVKKNTILAKVLILNISLDRKQVSEEERELIASKIRAEIYKFYNIQEPDSVPINSWQLIINH